MDSFPGRQLNRWLIAAALMVSAQAQAAPELKVIVPEQPARPNKPYVITYEATWDGDPAKYSILPAEIGSIDWGTVRVLPTQSTVRDGQNVVTQKVEIIPGNVGEFKAPDYTLLFLSSEVTSPAESVPNHGMAPPVSSASPSLGAEPFNIMVTPPRTLVFWISGGLGASLLLTALGWWSAQFLRRPQPTLETVPKTDFSHIQSQLHLARQLRLDGKFYEFYAELSRIVAGLSTQDHTHASLAEALRTRTQQVGYQGTRPTDDQIDGDFRDVERAVARERAKVETA